MQLAGSTALITGGAHRVGKAVTLSLAAAGANVVVNYNSSREAADATVVEGGNLEGFLNEEQSRYEEQLNDYAQMLVAIGDQPIKLGLYFPLMKGWREWSC